MRNPKPHTKVNNLGKRAKVNYLLRKLLTFIHRLAYSKKKHQTLFLYKFTIIVCVHEKFLNKFVGAKQVCYCWYIEKDLNTSLHQPMVHVSLYRPTLNKCVAIDAPVWQDYAVSWASIVYFPEKP